MPPESSNNPDLIAVLQSLVDATRGNKIYPTTLLSNPYKFRVFRAAAYSSAAASFSILQLDSKDFDTSNNVDVTTNKGRFTAPVAGFYCFSASMALVTGVTNAQIKFYKNGATSYAVSGQNFSNNAAFGTSGMIRLDAGDYVEVQYYTQSAATVASAEFSGFLLSVL